MLFLTLLDVKADTLKESEPFYKQVFLEYDKLEVDYHESNTTLPIDFEYDNESNCEFAYFYFLSDKEKVFTSSPDAYAYKIDLYTGGGWGDNYQVIWSRPVLGTTSELVTGKGEYSTIEDLQTYYNESIWIVTDGAIKDIYLGIMHYCYQSYVADNYYFPDIYYHYNFDCTVTPYTVEEFAVMEESNQIAKDTQDAIKDQTDVMNEQKDIMEDQKEIMEEQSDTQKGILSKITEFFGGFFENMTNSLIGLIVPSKEDIADLFDRLNQFFSDTFGFLYYPFDFLYQLFDVFLNTPENYGVKLTLPGFTIMGYTVWESMDASLIFNTDWYRIFSYVRTGTGFLLCTAFLIHLRNFFDDRFGGGGS